MDIVLSSAYYCPATFVISVQIQAYINVRLLGTEDFSSEWEVFKPR